MRKRPSIASEYLVSVSHQCIASVPTFETSNPSVLLHIRQILTGWKLLPQPPRESMSLVVSLVMSSVMSSVVSLVMSLVMSLVVWGRCDSMLSYGSGIAAIFYISHNLSVEMGNFTDK